MQGRRWRRWGVIVAAVVLLLVGAFLARDAIDVPFTGREQVWAIGLYEGSSPLTVADTWPNPLLTASDVDDPNAIGVADPWILVDGDEWLLFFEVIRRDTRAPNDEHGVIGLSTSLDAGTTWQYQGVILEEPWHLSYPQVFAEGDSYYMVPESLAADQVSLYRADDFPRGWSQQAVLLDGEFTDPTIFMADGQWWLLVTESAENPDDTLRLFVADELSGPYQEHPASPIVDRDVTKARSAGPVVVTPEGPVRFAQDNREGYGHAVRAFVITALTETRYTEEEVATSPLLSGSGEGWNADGMHHIAPIVLPDGRWISAVDGFFYQRRFGFDR